VLLLQQQKPLQASCGKRDSRPALEQAALSHMQATAVPLSYWPRCCMRTGPSAGPVPITVCYVSPTDTFAGPASASR
jgi:hypothetical protein